jgi:hypothetical protein
MSAPVIRFAASGSALKAFEAPYEGDRQPALLVSYAFKKSIDLVSSGALPCRDWVMDSGAFTAFTLGKAVNLTDYIEACRRLRDSPKPPVEIFALDVIGDWRASLRNTEAMWAAGIEAVPCYHANEPEDVLIGMARDYPKLALGGVALKKATLKTAWARRCFDRIWPKRVHGFAYGGRDDIMSLPWDSVDATTWHINAAGFGQWRYLGSIGGKQWGKASWRGKQNLRAEVAWYLALERQAQARWRETWAEAGAVA